jgi:hypothetical protein
MQASQVSLLMLLLTPVASFPVSLSPKFTDPSLFLSFPQRKPVSSFALRGLRGGFVADAQQHIFAAARQEASKADLVSQKASVSTEFEIPPPAPGATRFPLQKHFIAILLGNLPFGRERSKRSRDRGGWRQWWWEECILQEAEVYR